MTSMILPNHTNSSGSAFGGWLLKQLDLAAFNAAQRHHRGASPPVTVSIDDVQFLNQLRTGHVLTCEACVTRTFGSSLEVEVVMFGEDPAESFSSWPVLRSHATFVAMGPDGRAAKVGAFVPTTTAEHASFEAAGERRASRLERRSLASAPPLVLGRGDDHRRGSGSGSQGSGSQCSHSSPRFMESYVEKTESVFSKDTNARGTAFGGQLLAWGGMACSISAARYAGMAGMPLAATDEVAFLRPVRHGDTVVVGAEVTGAWEHSLEVGLSIEREDPGSGERENCLSAFFTFVTPLDSAGRRRELAPITDTEDAARSAGAEERKARRRALLQGDGWRDGPLAV